LKASTISKEELAREGLIAEEMLVSRLLKEAVDKSYPENRIKSEIVEQYTAIMHKFDKNANLLERRGKFVLETAKTLLDRYMKLFPQLKKQAREKDLVNRI
jgi:ribosomal protein S17E